MKRALILAGGGIKVAFQAGVLQVWLDEAGLEFDLADGASGGTFNLAMWCQGMSGTQIADNWRHMSADAGVDPNWQEYPKLFMAESLMKLDKFRDNVFTGWGLDWDAIKASKREATFNVYDFTDHELVILEPSQMDADMLCACVSLPMWFPPVRREGKVYIDPVYITDANLEEAIRRGADELWIMLTVSRTGTGADGFVNNYFAGAQTRASLGRGQFPAQSGRPVAADHAHPEAHHGWLDLRVFARFPDLPVMMVTAYGDMSGGGRGAADHCQHPAR